MGRVCLSIDGLKVETQIGTAILEAALQNGIYIPHLCYCPGLKPSGICRLCIVEVAGGSLVTSCRVPVEEGMSVKTTTPEVEQVRRTTVEMLIAHHHTDCRNCPSTGRCDLQRIMARLRLNVKRMGPLRWPKEKLPLDTSNPFFDYDPNRCILCEICVRTCESVHAVSMLQLMGRGQNTKVAFFGNGSTCELCQECVARCPVGALLPKDRATSKTEP